MIDEQPSLLRTVIFTIIRVTGFALGLFFLGGPYYHLLDAMFDSATGMGNVELTAWSTWVYWMFYYGYPSIMVFGMIVSIAYMFLVLRKRYWASEEVYV